MSWSPSSPVTGGPQTGFTSPTYTIVSDVFPDGVNGKQNAVSALGGTQTGVTVHSVSSPFTLSFARPKTYKYLGKPNPVTGLLPSVPSNTYKVIVRKGVTPLAGQPIKIMQAVSSVDVPAGSDIADSPNVRAALSLLYGAVWQQSAGVGDTVVSGVM